MDRRAIKRDKKRQQIVEKATEILKNEGISAVTIRRIGDEMDLTAPSLYTYFPDKNDIIYAVYEKTCHDMLAEMLAQPILGTLESFLSYVTTVFNFRMENWYRLRDTLLPHLPKEKVPETFLQARQVLVEHLQALRLKSLVTEQDVFVAMRTILALIDGSIQFIYQDVPGHNREFSLKIVLKGVTSLVHAWNHGW